VKTRRRRGLVALYLTAGLGAGGLARADLDEYVAKKDGAFAWSTAESKEAPGGGRVSRLKLTSQAWQGRPWEHQLTVCEPAGAKATDAMLLFITGGSNDGRERPGDAATGLALARACGARCAVLAQVPNQPLMGDRHEDDLIAETFVRYLETKDETLPLLFPMVKSAVRAMDALQAWADQAGRPVGRFVVSGASKRGWTTWLTAAADKRVVAIAPMVIPTLNMRAQNKHQLEVWGKYSEQIRDYTERGLTEKIDTPEGTKLWHMIDPYSYRDRLALPKLLINGTNDRYWTLDSLNLFWDDLKGPKWVVYLPNAGHGLDQHRDYAIHGVGALFRHAISGRSLPTPSWSSAEEAGTLSLRVKPPEGQSPWVEFWYARSDSRDFREARWDSLSPVRPLAGGDRAVVTGTVDRSERGYVALFGDLTFDVDGLEYHLSTEIVQAGPKAAGAGR
jgi:PhoPQ-activated pathogenicity-related protein